MEVFLRVYGIIVRILYLLVQPILYLMFIGFKKHEKLPAIKNSLLCIPAVDLAEKIRNKEITSESVVNAYIDRIREVNTFLNAVVEDRFDAALEDAKKADKMCKEMPLLYLINNFPLLGVPFTVKESIAVKGLSHTSGWIARKNLKATKDSIVVEKLKNAGCIPLLVSNTPEFCTSWECYNYITGRTLNPYHPGLTSGGSSGGEAALLGAGASIFGLGSDVGGSIRMPGLFCGIFGHKPTASLISNDGHFPVSSDEDFQRYLTIGPMCRYAKDLPTLTYILSDEKVRDQLKLDKPIHTTEIKVFYLESMGWSLSIRPVEDSIQDLIRTAVSHFKANGLQVERPDFDMSENVEICSALMFAIDSTPCVLDDKENPNSRKDLFLEILKSFVGRSDISFAALYFAAVHAAGGFVPASRRNIYREKFENLKNNMVETLGENGVLFYPTFNQPAFMHYDSVWNLGNTGYSAIFNILGFPATHVPCGKDKNGIPIGFQVVAAPLQDRLCFVMAAELEAAFGGFKFD